MRRLLPETYAAKLLFSGRDISDSEHRLCDATSPIEVPLGSIGEDVYPVEVYIHRLVPMQHS